MLVSTQVGVVRVADAAAGAGGTIAQSDAVLDGKAAQGPAVIFGEGERWRWPGRRPVAAAPWKEMVGGEV